MTNYIEDLDLFIDDAVSIFLWFVRRSKTSNHSGVRTQFDLAMRMFNSLRTEDKVSVD